MKLTSMHDLLVHELKDLLSAEKQLVKALPKMAKAASSESLRTAIESHLEETKNQVERLNKAFELMEKPARPQTCKAMQGLVEEAAELLEQDGEPSVKDAAMIAAAQRVEHYEMAGYGAARTFAEILGYTEIADLLQSTLDEEKAADEKLNQIAMGEINAQAAS
jgi:ferritin-like metal-binding protein YciE